MDELKITQFWDFVIHLKRNAPKFDSFPKMVVPPESLAQETIIPDCVNTAIEYLDSLGDILASIESQPKVNDCFESQPRVISSPETQIEFVFTPGPLSKIAEDMEDFFKTVDS